MEHDSAAESWPLFFAFQESALGEVMRSSLVLYPIVAILHIMGFAVLVGSIVSLDLRLLGLGRGIPIRPMARLVLPLARTAFAVALTTGFLLFSADAAHVVGNPAFQAKMLLLLTALVTVVAAHAGPWRKLASWGDEVPGGAKVTATLSLGLWLSVVLCGRLIAYF
jgi:hypothetical protein